MATCTLIYSPDLARSAVKTFFWRRFKTPLGIWFLLSIPIMAAAIWLVYSLEGPNWFVGAFGFLLIFNLIIQGSYYFSLPKAFARRLSDPTLRTSGVETSPKGIGIVNGPNAVMLSWDKFKHIWIYDKFIIVAAKPPMVRFTFLPTEGMTPEVRRDLEAVRLGKAIT